MYNIISAIYLENLMMVPFKCTDLKLFLTITFISYAIDDVLYIIKNSFLLFS